MPTTAIDIFCDAIERSDESRAAFVARSCKDDSALRREVMALLDVQKQAERSQFLDPDAPVDLPLQVGEQVAEFTIVSTLGEGGMGAVYLARQANPDRLVALKVLRPGARFPEFLQRFQREAEILSRLDHPGIARVLRAGKATDGRPFLAMELVVGSDLITHADKHQLDSRTRIELLRAVCDALEHAHRHGVIHRDLKPANILVDQRGRPRILDFGIARLTDAETVLTSVDSGCPRLVGTVRYMSPEQCAGRAHEVDTRSDVHAIGVIAFQMLSGKLPYAVDRDTSLPEVARIVRDEQPRALRSVCPSLPRELCTIVDKAVEKSPDRRYQTVRELSDDLARFLDGRTILARPASLGYQVTRIIRRHRAASIGVLATLVALILGLAGTSWQWMESRRAESRVTAAFHALAATMATSTLTPVEAHAKLLDAGEDLFGYVSLDDEIAMDVHDRFGVAFQQIGDHTTAARYLRRGYDASVHLYGPLDQRTLRASNLLSDALREAGMPVEAEQLARRTLADAGFQDLNALSTHEFRTPSDALRALKFAIQIGQALHDQGRFDEARSVLEASLRETERWSTASSPVDRYDVAVAATALGFVFMEYPESRQQACDLFQWVIQFRSVRPDPQVVREQTNLVEQHFGLALCLIDSGDIESAKTILESSLRLRVESMLTGEPLSLRMRAELARVIAMEGDHVGASQLLTGAIEDGESLMPHHWLVAMLRAQHGIVQAEAGHVNEARESLLAAREGLQAAGFGPSDYRIARIDRQLADLP